MTNLNPILRNVAEAQGIEIGSPEWIAGGLNVGSHWTGGNNGAYGWQHKHQLSPSWVRAVFANYCARPIFYTDEPLRENGYYNGGRPDNWSPESPWDLSSGEQVFWNDSGNIVKVTGIDQPHFWADPLWAIIKADDPTHTMRLPNGKAIPAAGAARQVGRLLVNALAGMLRHKFKYTGGGRPGARVIDTFTQAWRHGALDKEDIAIYLDWLDQVQLPKLEQAPGVGIAPGKGPNGANGYCILYHEIGWSLLPIWEAAQDFIAADTGDPRNFGPRLMAVAKRLAQWAVDIEEIAGGGMGWEWLRVTQAMKTGDGGKALPTLKGAITKDDLAKQWDYKLWSVASADVARELTGGAGDALYAACKAGALKAGGDAVQNKCWLVDRNREYVS